MKSKSCMTMILFTALLCINACIPKAAQVAAPQQEHTIRTSPYYTLCTLVRDETSKGLAQKYLKGEQDAWIIEDANPGASFRANETIAIPLKDENRAGLFPDGFQTVPILCYHRFAKSCASKLCMPEKIFFTQMAYLKENNYRVISLKELARFLSYEQSLPKNSIVITIDDGYRSVYDIAFPILKEFGFSATIFIYTDFIGGGSAVNWDQIRQMKAAGFDIGSHTLSHSDLSRKKENETQQDYIHRITNEIYHSKAILDKKLDQDTLYFAYPFGRSNATVNNLCKKAGYQLGLSVHRGANPFPTSAFNLYRDQILSRDPDIFKSRLNTFFQVSLKDSAYD